MINQQNKRPFILLVDDDPNYLESFQNTFEADFIIETLQHPNQILSKIELAKLESKEIELILLDFDFAGKPDGLKFLATEDYKFVCDQQIPIVLITMFAPNEPIPDHYRLTPNDLNNYGQILKLYKQEYDYNTWRIFIKKHLKRKRVNLFINYADLDKSSFEKYFYPTLQTIQKQLKDENIDMNLYHEISPGENISKWQQLYNQSDIILHWLTRHLLASDEYVELFSNNKTNIPILARPCLWKSSKLRDLKALPDHDKYLFNVNGSDKPDDQLCLEVAEGIKRVIKDFLNPPAPPQK
ncbi:MAG: hypothetical protein JNM36_13520 [Chitinophagales bacterium]|nr:hypothetical protein [Chitinophagales bacterium]